MRNSLSFVIAGIAGVATLLWPDLPKADILQLPIGNQMSQASDPAAPKPGTDGATEETADGDEAATDDQATTGTEINAENPPEVITDLSSIPFPVRKMRDLILEAAKSGDAEKLRPYIGYGDDVTMLSLGGFDEDPIAFLKSLSGDPEGQEILAIMSEILEAPLVHLHPGTEEEVFVWPYFYSYPLEKLTAAQRVQLFRIITYGDYEEMVTFGNYIFYRIGITPQGRWRFFVAGD